MKPPFPARLHVLLARDADSAIVIRRGPSRHTAVIDWNRRTDEFKLGQWLCGRIYERRCDLSPDGKHLIYFAMNGRWSSKEMGSWTAISRAPYLKALTLYAKGDCWNGGGLFRSNRDYWLNDGPFRHEEQFTSRELRRVDLTAGAEIASECLPVYYERLQRDGWQIQPSETGQSDSVHTILEKRVGNRWQLRKLVHAGVFNAPGKGCYFDEHLLHNPMTLETLPSPNWEWADVDEDRVIWAQGGKLFAGQLNSDGWDYVKELADFNGMRFEQLQAPY